MTQLFVALDVASRREALELGTHLAPAVDGFKVGLELLLGVGPSMIADVAELGRPVFADAKLHDIPHTVERAARQVAKAGARFVSVHASGGRTMIEAAISGFGGRGVLAVTVLTSLEDIAQQVESLAQDAAAANAEGVVCSVKDLPQVIRAAPGLLYVTPGIRTATSNDDQIRTASPAEAVTAGAHILVVGRPITRSSSPLDVIGEIRRSISEQGSTG
jgi:orotidine-5'-phosphate decarboxylase